MRGIAILIVVAGCGAASTAPEAVVARPASGKDCGVVCRPGMLPAVPPPPPSSCEGTGGGLLGKVRVDGQPPGQPIAVAAMSSCGRYPIMTDANGIFRMAELRTGNYLVEATVGTIARAVAEAEVLPGEVVSVELELRADEVARGREDLADRQACGCPIRL